MQKITVDCKELEAAVKWVRRAAHVTGSSLPILKSVLLKVNAGTLWIQGTNLDTYATATIPCSTVSMDPVVVNAAVLLDALAGKTDTATLEVEEKVVRVRVGNGMAAIPTGPVGDMPLDAGTCEDCEYTLLGCEQSNRLEDALRKVLPSCSTDSYLRPELCGMNLEIEENQVLLTGTNGHRMHQTSLPSGLWMTCGTPVLIPAISLKNLLSAGLGNGRKKAPPCQVRIRGIRSKPDPDKSDSDKPATKEVKRFPYVSLQFNTRRLTMRTLEDRFPESYRSLIPSAPRERFVVDADTFSELLSRALPYTDRKTKQLRVSCGTEGVQIDTENQGTASFSEPLKVVSWDPDSFVVDFNGLYLLDAMTMFKGKKVTFYQDHNLMTSMIRAEGCPVNASSGEHQRFGDFVLVMPRGLPASPPEEHRCPECGALAEEGGCPTCNPPCPNAEESPDA